MPYTVSASGITKSFGGHLALDHVDLAIDTGSVFALLGPNGAGKTTMVRILATLVRPDAGTATVAGHDLLADPAGVRRSISLTGQYAAVDDKLTGQENLEMMAGLDPRSRDQVWGAVRDLADDGVTILLTTQYLEEADQLADMIAMLDRGQVVARGTADQLKSSIGTEVIRLQFGDRRSYNRALGQLDAVRADRRLHILEIASNGSADRVRDLLSHLQAAGAPALKVSTHRPSLDDVFLSLTGGQAAATASAATKELAR